MSGCQSLSCWPLNDTVFQHSPSPVFAFGNEALGVVFVTSGAMVIASADSFGSSYFSSFAAADALGAADVVADAVGVVFVRVVPDPPPPHAQITASIPSEKSLMDATLSIF